MRRLFSRLKFASTARYREEGTEARGLRRFDELQNDLRFACRTLRKNPGFAAVAILALGLGIGANSAIFSVVHGVLLKSLPFRDAPQLYKASMVYPDGTAYASLSAPDFMSIREENRVFEQVEAYTTSGLRVDGDSDGVFTLLGAGAPMEVRGASVSDGLFDLLGLPMAFGRSFLAEENRPGMGMVTVMDHGFWRRELGGDRAVLGRTLVVGGDSYRIVGVLAPGAQLLREADLYVPLEYGERFSATTPTGRRSEYLQVLARARPGSVLDQIHGDMRRVGTLLQSAFPETNERLTFTATPLREIIIAGVRTPLFLLLGAVGFVLLVACANVANLLLARASARQGELAVRAALGAGRSRLLRQLLTEAVVLGLAGGVVGLAIAHWGTQALAAAQPADIPRIEEVGVNAAVVLFTFGIALLTGLAFGALPALYATDRRLMAALREGGRGGGPGHGGHRIRAALVVAEMALAVVLLTGAGLLIRSFVELTRVHLGFQPERAVAVRIAMQGDPYRSGQQVVERVDRILERLRALPGVTAAAATTLLPLSGGGLILAFNVESAPPPSSDVNREIRTARVTPDYFRAIGASLLRGRGFTDRDDEDAPRVVLINEAAMRHWFPGEDPIGRRVDMAGVREVVGVVADVLQYDPGRPVEPQLYTPFAQLMAGSVQLVVRTAGDPVALAPAIRAQVHAIDPNLPIAEITPLEQLVAQSVARPRLYASLLALFAGVGLALAATGIFGVMSYAVAQRAHEMSIRMALGARAGEVVRLIMGRAMALAAVGLAVGIAAALALGGALRSQLFGVSPVDPLTLGAVALLLGATAAAASYLPARRAASLDPVAALRGS
ncbi:MAG: FtsX-like permease family protein [Luteitalea sp.]|nr:FtsX-like permease family protein [Luteitalea sp.]